MTIKDIAKELNLSIATVSKALNGATDISESTRKLICEYAESVQYRSRKSMAWNGRIALLWAKEEQREKYSAPSLVSESFLSMAQKERYVVVEGVLEKMLAVLPLFNRLFCLFFSTVCQQELLVERFETLWGKISLWS